MVNADVIAQTVIDRFNKIPKKGKPIERSNGLSEWTVLAGIVAIHGSDDTNTPKLVECLSLATGVKATPNELLSSSHGNLLHDMHAEVLAIRGFNLFLINECKKLKESGLSHYLEATSSSSSCGDTKSPYKLKKSISLALYVSELPCGDASMSVIRDGEHEESGVVPSVPWTGPLDLTSSSGTVRGRSHFNITGIVRTKPGRKDSRVTYSKSCSDKLALRQFTSLLLSPTQKLVSPEGAYLSMLVVPDTQLRPEDLERAFSGTGRLRNAANPVHSASVGPFKPVFFQYLGTSVVFEYHKQSSSKPCPCAILSVADAHHEVILNGVKMGSKLYSEKGRSVVSRMNLSQLVLQLGKHQLDKDQVDNHQLGNNQPTNEETYLSWKSNSQLKKLKSHVYKSLATWEPTEPDDFVLPTV